MPDPTPELAEAVCQIGETTEKPWPKLTRATENMKGKPQP